MDRGEIRGQHSPAQMTAGVRSVARCSWLPLSGGGTEGL